MFKSALIIIATMLLSEFFSIASADAQVPSSLSKERLDKKSLDKGTALHFKNKKEKEKVQTLQPFKTKKQWEFGFGLGGLNVAHYIGSKDTRNIAIPIPYVKYQGNFIKADRRGVRGVFWKGKQTEINMSFDLSLPVKSTDNRARSGMPDLELGIELGPALEYVIFEKEHHQQQLIFKLPIRGAFEVGGDAGYYGWITSPRIQYQRQLMKWKWRSHISIEYADQSYQSYFYDVDNEFVTDTRPFYQSTAGLLDYAIGTSLSKRVNQWFFGGFVNYIDLSRAENINSPLIKTTKNVNFGAFLIWVF